MRITIHASGTTYETEAGDAELLLDLIRQFPIRFSAPCGGHGNCGGCKVQIRGAGEVLSCMTRVGDVAKHATDEGLVMHLPDEKSGQIMTDMGNLSVVVDPILVCEEALLPMPSLSDQRPDTQRFQDTTNRTLSFDAIRSLPRRLREHEGKIRYIVRRDTGEVVDLVRHMATGPYGVAVDVGTTTVAAYLYDLQTGQLLDRRAVANPQMSFGADVISRIGAAMNSRRDQSAMKEWICNAIQELTSTLAADAIQGGEDVQMDEVRLFAVAGNTTMMHLLTNTDPDAIARAPFAPVFTSGWILPSAQLGLSLLDGALCCLLPSVSAYVGADIVCGILACGMDRPDARNRLLIDIGTNGEIALECDGRLLACSTAAGPAFEGAGIRCGMSAVAGAIDHVRVKDGKLTYTWLDGRDNATRAGRAGDMAKGPVGLCGSAILDTVRVLLENDILSFTGRMAENGEPEWADRLIRHEGENAFVIEDGSAFGLTDPVVLRQDDIREIQNAKAAIAAGIGTLLDAAGITPDDVDEVYLAGGFGNYMDPDSALAIGLLPSEFAGKAKPAGNTAGAGAALCLLSMDALGRADEIAKRVEYVELSADKGFSDRYIDAMVFPGE